MFEDFHRDGMRWALGVLGPIDLRPMLGTISVPTLLLYGGKDLRSPADVVGAVLHENIPDSVLVVIPEAPHLCSLERPGEFNDALLGFLASA
jgi:pimeloyl-ACP methyl ester carboxylesterase